MTEPTAPTIPDTAPQDVKDFFDCRGNTLAWQPGEVSWLGLPVTPNVTFSAGATAGSVTINVSLAGGLVNFTLPASVNAAGELVVDTSSVPDLSDWGLGGRADIDAAIKRINDWFKHNGKKLKPATLVGGAVTLEKTPIAPVPAVAVPVVPLPPVTPPPAKPKPVAPPPASPPPASGSGCSLLGGLMVLMLFGVIVLGAGIGFVLFGGPGPVAQATATPSVQPTARPTSSPSASPTASPSSAPSPSVRATPTPSPGPSATSTASPLPVGQFSAVCIRVVHDQVGQFVSYLDWFVWWTDFNVEYFEVTVIGANNGEPQRLEFESRSQAYEGLLGLHQAGDKRIVSVIARMSDGSEINLTQDLIDEFGSDEFTVRFPQEDEFGDCPPD
jgi:hypothetical protein